MQSTIIYSALAAGLAFQPTLADFVWGRTYHHGGDGLSDDLEGTFTTTCDSLDNQPYDQDDLNACSFSDQLTSDDPFLDYVGSELSYNTGNQHNLCDHPIPGCESLELVGNDDYCGEGSRAPLGEPQEWGHVVVSATKEEVGTCYFAQNYESKLYRVDGSERVQAYEALLVCMTEVCGDHSVYERRTERQPQDGQVQELDGTFSEWTGRGESGTDVE